MRGLWKCSGRADDGKSYCFYELRQVAGLGPIPFRFVIIPVSDFWGAKLNARCEASDCSHESRNRSGGLCIVHYYRMRRTGSLDTTNPKRTSRGFCVVEGCEKRDCGPHQLCSMHHSRMKRHGTTDAPPPAKLPSGDRHHAWTADLIGYGGAHMRVRSNRGKASDQKCQCGAAAQHWSYNHADPSERIAKEGPYSPDPAYYDAKCVKCHKLDDLAYLGSKKASA